MGQEDADGSIVKALLNMCCRESTARATVTRAKLSKTVKACQRSVHVFALTRVLSIAIPQAPKPFSFDGFDRAAEVVTGRSFDEALTCDQSQVHLTKASGGKPTLHQTSSTVGLKRCPIKFVFALTCHVITAAIFADRNSTCWTSLDELSCQDFTHVCFGRLSRTLQPLVFTHETHHSIIAPVAKAETTLLRAIHLHCSWEENISLQSASPFERSLHIANLLRKST